MSDKSEMLLQVNDLSKTFPGVKALDEVHFELVPGEVHALVGENGAGKSTLIKILSGAYVPDAGEVVVNGQIFHALTPSLAQAQGIRTIYQERGLLPWLSVAENILLGNLPGRRFLVSWTRLREKAIKILDDLELDLDPDALVISLGIGKQQSVEIAKALYQQAKILIMDEPTSALGRADVEKLFQTVKTLRKQGIGIIYISHHLEEIFEIADRVTVLRDGQVIGTQDISGITSEDLIGLMVGRDLSGITVKEDVQIGDVLLRVESLSHGTEVRDVSLEVRRGEIVGIAGMVGSGRTQLARLIFGADKADQGAIHFNGNALEANNPRIATTRGIVLIPEDRKNQGLVLCLDLVDNVNSASMSDGKVVLNLGKLQDITRKQMESLDIRAPSTRTEVQYLSGGNQQKVVLAKWLEYGAELFIFDEPTQGVDVGAKLEIHRLMVDLVKNGKAILMVSSDMAEILELSDRILVMRNGQIEGEFLSAEATERKIIECALGKTNGRNAR
jgi:ribose transport system ATP-binding protein